MSNILIQQSLIDIEQNLKKLESARNQVGNMTDKSEQLISSVVSVIESIEAIKNSFSNDENYLKNSVHDSLEEFSKSLSNGAENANKKTIDISEKYKHEVQENTKLFVDELKSCTENANNKASEITSKYEKVFNDTIIKMDEFKSNLSDVQKSILDFDLEHSLDKIRAELSNLTEQITKNQATTTNKVDELKVQLKSTKDSQEKSAKLNLIVLAAGFVITIIIILIAK